MDVMVGCSLSTYGTVRAVPTIEATDALRGAAQRLERVDPAGIRKLLGSSSDASLDRLAQVITDMTNQLVRDLAAGKSPVYVSSADAGVTPAEAARVLGVSRQFVDRMIAAGRLSATRKPGSSHRLVSVSDLERLATQRLQRRDGVARAVDAIRGDLPY